MADTLVHRGPDGFGTHVDGAIGLASRRLAIVDLSKASDQPMGLPERDLWLTFNGEIHNYLELRRELESVGHRFRSSGDTEVVLAAYAQWGQSSLERLNGMWAIALWDGAREELVLARDRFGIKPLCYSARGRRIAFASEPKAILALDPGESRPDTAEVERFLAGAFPDRGPSTFFATIRNVPPATSIVFSRHGAVERRYWSFMPRERGPRPTDPEEFRELLTDAVALRTRSDAPLGVCLSGGLDSSAIVSLLPEASAPVHCFSTRYEDPVYDESRYARLMAERHGLVMHWVRPEASDLLETIRSLVWHHDAPVPIRGRLAHWFVMREAARSVKVVLEGHGSDELLGGYGRDAIPYLADRLRRDRRPSLGLLREAAQLGRVAGTLRWFVLTGLTEYRRDPRRVGESPLPGVLNNALWNGVRRDGLPESLHGADSVAMAHSVESRVPFLDHRLVELCFTLGFDSKISDGWTKSLLRRAMVGRLPGEILWRRRKAGFAAPVAPWLRLAPNLEAVRELLLDPRTSSRGILTKGSIELGLKRFRYGGVRHARWQAPELWRWITLELWFRAFIDGGGA
jgi:asparagine synthase (glutamine-hydrolysing)